MKYIIDIPDDSINKYVSLLDKESFVVPITVGSDSSLRFNTGLKLKPYTEPDHKTIEDEVWEFARGLLYYTDENWESLMNLLLVEKASYQEAKARYEAWKKQKDELRVGDEVEYTCCNNKTVRFIVTGIADGIAYGFKHICEYDDSGEYCDIDMLWKTGRHFDEVEELLKKMEED